MSTSIRAIFTKLAAFWTVVVNAPIGDGSGHTLPPTGVHNVEHGKTFTITAYPDTGSSFTGWKMEDGTIRTENPITIAEGG